MVTKQNSSQNGGSNEHLPLTITIEGREFQWATQFITGKEIRQIAGLSDESDIYLAITDPWDDEPVGLESKIDLGREGVESFYVRNPLSFIVEGNGYQWKKQYITGAEIRKLAGLSGQDEIYLLLQNSKIENGFWIKSTPTENRTVFSSLFK
jgi:hypothetical protein